MEQFSLEKYLDNQSRKITTRLGNREVRIICWNRKNNSNRPIITLMIDPDGNEYTTFHTKNGFVDEKEKYLDKRDLFFADEEEETIDDTEMNSLAYLTELGYTCIPPKKEEELTEFEKELEMMMVSFSNGNLGSDVIKEMSKQKLHDYAHRLLDLVRKELEKDIYDNGCRMGYDIGKEDALKNLSKWRKSPKYRDGIEIEFYQVPIDKYNSRGQYVLDTNGYYIPIEELLELPKGE